MKHLKISYDCAGTKLNQYWKKCVGGGRVGEALRADFQKHLELTQKEIPFEYIRMHGLFHEDMMVYREENGKPIYNWQYVDLVYDHWLSIGIRPFVELGFMPYDMASGDHTVFWWKGNATPPSEWNKWSLFIEEFVKHLIERYGLTEVSKWYFEVWNEPNLSGFWLNGDFDAYVKLYEVTVKAVKKVNKSLKVGGPATSGTGDKVGVAPWGREFLDAITEKQLPLDFFSTHPYPTFYPVDLKGEGYMEWDGPNRIVEDLNGFIDLLKSSAYPDVEIHLTEWNSSPSPRDPVHDTAFKASFIVQNILLGEGLTDSLSYWVVSDIFEENRQGDTPFHGGFGLINIQGLKKPSYHGYWFLNQLGEEKIDSGADYIVTKHADGKITALFWNYVHYSEKANDNRIFQSFQGKGLEVYGLFEEKGNKKFNIDFSDFDKCSVTTVLFDREHGSVFDEWCKMGGNNHILPEELRLLKQKMEMKTEVVRLDKNDKKEKNIDLKPYAVMMLEIRGI